jgi:RNA polymerase sigma-70 factor (ECF subfamily)
VARHPSDRSAPYAGPVGPELRDVSDAVLVVAMARWHEDALAEAYRRHAGTVFSLARRVLGDESRAQDVVQEVFVRLWRNPERYDPGRGSLRSFLLSQCHGRAVDLLRADGSRARREEREARFRSTAEGGYELEREVWDLAVAEHVRDALGGLPLDERRAIELAYFGGHSYREVAVLLDTPEGTVKSRIRAGLRRLHAHLSDRGVAGAGVEG